MIRWILLLFSLVSLGPMFFGRSPGWVLLGVGGFLFGSLATALSFAQARISSRARAEDLSYYERAPRDPAAPATAPARDAQRPPD